MISFFIYTVSFYLHDLSTLFFCLQTQQRITITNNDENKEGFLYKDLEEAPNELVYHYSIEIPPFF